MNDITLFAFAGVVTLVLLMALGLIRLWREQNKLKHDIQALDKKLQGCIDDVVGLCSAAVTVDKRLTVNESRLNDVFGSISLQQTQTEYHEIVEEDEPQGYDLAIEKIRAGADVEELVKSCGLTRDEAVLLVRLHRR